MISVYVVGALLVALLFVSLFASLRSSDGPGVPFEDLGPAARKEAALEALREVEFERAAEKLSEEEYRRLRARYGRLALDAEEELEQGGGAALGPDAASSDEGDAEAVADREGAAGGGAPSSEGPPDG